MQRTQEDRSNFPLPVSVYVVLGAQDTLFPHQRAEPATAILSRATTAVIPIIRMVFGINATKTAVLIAETKGAGDTFAITTIRSIPFQVRSGGDLAELLQCLTTVFHRGDRRAPATVALLKCSSGRFGSCLEAIKGEAMTELAAFQNGLRVIKVVPQCLKKTLGCATGQKWRDRAAELFNPDGKLRNWSKGAAGAVSVAFKAVGD